MGGKTRCKGRERPEQTCFDCIGGAPHGKASCRDLRAETQLARLGESSEAEATEIRPALLVRAFIRQLGYQKEMSGLSDYQAVAPIFDAMMAEKIKEMSVSDMVGGGYPFPVAVHFMQLLEKYTDLSPGDDVLDIGCGCGRLAATLTQHISLGGSYRGVDIVPGLIRFANKHIATRWPHFQFMTLDQDNPAYNHWRNDSNVVNPIHSLEESYTPGSITLCIATSLFTHMDEA